MRRGVLALPDRVGLKCSVCGRKGRYRRERFFALAGTDDPTMALLWFAKVVNCERALKQDALQLDDRCGIHYDLSFLEENR